MKPDLRHATNCSSGGESYRAGGLVARSRVAAFLNAIRKLSIGVALRQLDQFTCVLK